jgi:N12 class adenine-specific DNA methylase
VILKVTLRGRLRWSLSLRVRIVVKRIRVRDMVKDVTLKAGESNNTWIVNQVRLKAQL